MSPAQAAELLPRVVRLSALATGQGDLSYRPALEGWSRYYETPGDRLPDYHRISLVYANDELVSLAALKLIRTRGARPVDVIWLQLILTSPEYQRTAATVRALSQLLIDGEFQAPLQEGYLVARTPNPLVYEAATRLRDWINKRGQLEFSTVLPVIEQDGSLASVPIQHQGYLDEIVAMISQPEKFRRETFVVSGYYAAFGNLYKNYDFRCKSGAVREYFARHVRWETQDGLFLAAPFTARDRGGAT
jgi:hypothetical protein